MYKFVSENPLQAEKRTETLESFPPFGSVVDFEFASGGGEMKIYHGLGASPTGYLLIRSNVSDLLYESTQSPSEREYLLFTHGSGASEGTVWFF